VLGGRSGSKQPRRAGCSRQSDATVCTTCFGGSAGKITFWVIPSCLLLAWCATRYSIYINHHGHQRFFDKMTARYSTKMTFLVVLDATSSSPRAGINLCGLCNIWCIESHLLPPPLLHNTSNSIMPITFDRPVGSPADLKELEYISALHQTCLPKLRQDASISGTPSSCSLRNSIFRRIAY
jgi:hypothetical protein